MKRPLVIICLSTLALAQVHQHAKPPAQPPASKTAPRLGFVKTKDSSGIVDSDLLKQQKQLQDAGAAIHSMRDAHQAELMNDFVQSFNDTRECDRIVLVGSGDNKPDFALQVNVDSHDTSGLKPVWRWDLHDLRRNKPIPEGHDDSAQQTAKAVCTAIWNRVGPTRLTQSSR